MLRRKKKNTGKKLKREIEKSMKKAQLSHLDINDPDDINKIKEFMRLTANVCAGPRTLHELCIRYASGR